MQCWLLHTPAACWFELGAASLQGLGGHAVDVLRVWYGAGGGDSSAVQSELVNVKQIYSTGTAFAAVTAGGKVVTWGLSSRTPYWGMEWANCTLALGSWWIDGCN